MENVEVRVLSIGCSCINRFQFDLFVERHPSDAQVFPRGLFDWNIASLDVTLNILRRAADGALMPVLAEPEQFHVAWDDLIFNRALPGLSFFHEQEPETLLTDPARRAAFLGKVAHLAAPFVTPERGVHTHLVWSNLQPNLPDTVENVIDWDGFQLTQARYAEAKALGRRIFGAGTTFSFLSTPEDMDQTLLAEADVQVFDMPRGEDYVGAPTLYEETLRTAIASAMRPPAPRGLAGLLRRIFR